MEWNKFNLTHHAFATNQDTPVRPSAKGVPTRHVRGAQALAPLVAAVMGTFIGPSPRGAKAYQSKHFIKDDEGVTVADDEVKECEEHEKMLSLCPTMSPGESAVMYGHPESWKWQWRHAHYGQFGARATRRDPWECLNSCRALDSLRRPTSAVYTTTAQRQDCVNSCQQYFVEGEPARTSCRETDTCQ